MGPLFVCQLMCFSMCSLFMLWETVVSQEAPVSGTLSHIDSKISSLLALIVLKQLIRKDSMIKSRGSSFRFVEQYDVCTFEYLCLFQHTLSEKNFSKLLISC